MVTKPLTTGDLDYLQRTGFEPPDVRQDAMRTAISPASRRVLRVEAIGRLERDAPHQGGEDRGLITEDLLAGLSNYKVPVAFQVGGVPGRAIIRIGTWLPSRGAQRSLEENEHILRTGLDALFPFIDCVTEDGNPDGSTWALGGLVLGMPSAKPPAALDTALPLDRLLRALAGTTWSALVLAEPLDEGFTREVRLRVINEMRAAQTGAKLSGVPSPLTEHYVEMLTMSLRNLTEAQAMGAWRTAVYLLGDAQSYHRLSSVWRGLFSGAQSLPEPIRVWDRREAPLLAPAWSMPDPVEDVADGGSFRHPFQHQTMLTSSQLAAYVHFPRLETNGFAVRQIPAFDAVPPRVSEAKRTIALGHVLERGRVTDTEFSIELESLTRHAFVTGVTGSGKTNTVFSLLLQAAASDVPFLVIEPAKTEYRVLLQNQALGERLQIFTLGNENVSPFRLNPFEVPTGIPIAVHLDLLRSVFNVSFGMWTPLPQVLEVCLHAIYADRGWDVTSNTNRRLDGASDRSRSFPTLTDLLRKVEVVAGQLGYEDRVTADIRAALTTRLNSLRAGGKGRMLDAERSLPIEVLLDRHTLLELEGMGDDDDKAFLMGLIMIRLAEHRRTQGDTDGLRHLLVIEEAHRLLANPSGRRDETESDVRGKAVETFANLLSEVRAYGQGVMVVDQIPAKLSPDVIKSTNLKLAHRIVAGDDRETLAQAMAMTPRQSLAIATLPVGRAAVFAEGEDAPLLLQVARSKGGSKTWPSDDYVRDRMRARDDLADSLGAVLLPTSECDGGCLDVPAACEVARQLRDRPVVARALGRVVLSAVETPGGADRVWPDFVAAVDSVRPPWLDGDTFLRCLALHGTHSLADRHGALAGWTYDQTESVYQLTWGLFRARIARQETGDVAEALRLVLLDLQGGGYGPFPGCASIWGSRDGPCLCRYPVADLVAGGAYAEAWAESRVADAERDEGGRGETWSLCQDAAYHLIEFPEGEEEAALGERLADMARCTALCFGQQMLAAEEAAHPGGQRRAIRDLIDEAGHP